MNIARCAAIMSINNNKHSKQILIYCSTAAAVSANAWANMAGNRKVPGSV